MSAPLLVTGDFERGRAAREEERKAHHMKKSDTGAEIKRLREVNAELVEALGQLADDLDGLYAESEPADRIAEEHWTLTLRRAREALIRAEGS